MCILMATRGHPDYDLVLLSNRDEFFDRKTKSTSWTRNGFVLSPCDVALNTSLKKDYGTWIGVNKNGRVATILNLRLEDDCREKPLLYPQSRGRIPVAFLTSHDSKMSDWDSYEKFAERCPKIKKTGDFNFFYGDCASGDYRLIDSLGNTFAVLTNTEGSDEAYMVVSNDVFTKNYSDGKTPVWGKIRLAKEALCKLVKGPNITDKEEFIQKCFEVSSIKVENVGQRARATERAKETVFVSPIKVSFDDDLGTSVPVGEYYGTRSQVLMLVSKDRSHVTYIERIVHDSDMDAAQYDAGQPKMEKRFEFDII